VHFRFVIDEPQQRFAARARTTDAEDVFGRGVQVDDVKAVIEQDNAGAEAVDNPGGVPAERSVAGAAAIQRTLFCWT
jgi:hypothetical protein